MSIGKDAAIIINYYPQFAKLLVPYERKQLNEEMPINEENHRKSTILINTIDKSQVQTLLDTLHTEQSALKMAKKLHKKNSKKYHKLNDAQLMVMFGNMPPVKLSKEQKDQVLQYDGVINRQMSENECNQYTGISKYLVKKLGSNFSPDPKMSTATIVDILEDNCPIRLMDYPSLKNNSKSVLYNRAYGYWSANSDDLQELMSTLRKSFNKPMVSNVQNSLAQYVGSRNIKPIKPYYESKYLLLNNVVWNIITNRAYSIHSDFAEKLHFTLRNKLNVSLPITKHNGKKYVVPPKEPTFPNLQYAKIGKHTWKPSLLINAFGHNNKKLIRMFLTCLAFGFFGGHNFGINVDIVGPSGIGKSELFTIFSAIYNKTFQTNFSKLAVKEPNEFTFTSLDQNTSIIWLTECNANNVLSNIGTDIYDDTTNNKFRYSAKNQNDKIIYNPPTVFTEGTKPLQSTEALAGPYRRTIIYELPHASKQFIHSYYSTDINGNLSNPKTLAWILWNSVQALKKSILIKLKALSMPKSKQSKLLRLNLTNLKLNLGNPEDMALFPKIANKWHKEMLNDNSGISTWLDNYVLPYIQTEQDIIKKLKKRNSKAKFSLNDKHCKYLMTLLHPLFLFRLYGKYYELINPNDKHGYRIMPYSKFTREVENALKRKGYIIIHAGVTTGRHVKPYKQVSHIRNMNFNLTAYQLDHNIETIPKYYRIDDEGHRLHNDHTVPAPFGSQITGWFRIIKSNTDNY